MEDAKMEAEIGEAAGKVWQALHAGGPLSRPKVAKATGLSAELVNQAVGWLAREGKLVVEKKKKSEFLGLKD